MIFDSIQKVLIICAHADDESIACGGTINKLTSKGIDVSLVVVTKGETGIDHTGTYSNDDIASVRKEELLSAANLLGIEKVKFLDERCQEVTYSAKFMRQITKIIRGEKPDLIITHTIYEKHNDHVELSKTVIQSTWKAQEDILPELGAMHKVIDVWGFECVDTLPRIDYVVDISENIKVKLQALEEYKSQINIIKNIKSFVSGVNRMRGYQAGVNYAEAFLRISNIPVEIFK
jgi:LmbE family N-acetylglucosaminyl deacetylase